jgi:FkbM family methyltransferase
MTAEGLVETKFSNDLRLFCLPTSQSETRFVWWEIFVERQYLLHGITINDGDCLIDVGANIGMFDIFATQKWNDLRIYAFEPLPPIFAALSANVERLLPQYSGQVRLFNEGLSDTQGFADIVFYPKAPANSTQFSDDKQKEPELTAAAISLRDLWKFDKAAFFGLLLLYPFRRAVLRAHLRKLYRNGQRHRCQIRRLSDVITSQDIDTIDLLKIDVEGNELNVMKGIDDEHWERIRQLVVEISPSNLDQLDDLKKKLAGKGFRHIHLQHMGQQSFEEGNRMACNLYATG